MCKTASTCTKCQISNYCNHKVFYRTSLNYTFETSPHLLFVGEAPGESEYIHRSPFVGPAGHELNDLLSKALPPHITYVILNSILCTPYLSANRDKIGTPTAKEYTACNSNLSSFIHIFKPLHLIAVGKVAASALSKLFTEGDPKPAHHGIRFLQYTQVQHPASIIARSKSPETDRIRFILTIQNVVNQLPT